MERIIASMTVEAFDTLEEAVAGFNERIDKGGSYSAYTVEYEAIEDNIKLESEFELFRGDNKPTPKESSIMERYNERETNDINEERKRSANS